MKRFAYIFGILALSLNSFAQIWTKPHPLTVSGLPSEYLTEIAYLILHSSGELWCQFDAQDTVQYGYTHYIVHYDSQKREWVNPIKIPKGSNIYPSGGLVEDKKGRIWMIGSIYGSYYDGYSWSGLIEIPNPFGGNLTSSCRDSAGNIWIAGYTPYWGGRELIYIRYDGENWDSATRLTTHHSACWYYLPSLLSDKDGRVWVAWTNIRGCLSAPREGCYFKYYNGEEWSDSICVPDTGAMYPKLACDSRNRIWATWRSWPTNKYGDTAAIYVSYYEGEKWSTPILISKEVPMSYPVKFIPSPAIAVDGKDRVWVTWNSAHSDSCGDIWFVYYNGKEWSEPAPIYQRFYVDWTPSLIVDKEGKVWCWWSAAENYRWMSYICHTTEVGVEEESENNTIKPELLDISPNPFKAMTSVKWLGTGEGPISLEVYDATGRLVRTLAETQSPEPKDSTAVWDGKDDKGEEVPQGIYFIQLRTENKSLTRKVVLVK